MVFHTMTPHLDEVFGLVEEAERGVPGAVGAERHDVLQLLQAVPQVRPTVLLQLVVGRPAMGTQYITLIQIEFRGLSKH